MAAQGQVTEMYQIISDEIAITLEDIRDMRGAKYFRVEDYRALKKMIIYYADMAEQAERARMQDINEERELEHERLCLDVALKELTDSGEDSGDDPEITQPGEGINDLDWGPSPQWG